MKVPLALFSLLFFIGCEKTQPLVISKVGNTHVLGEKEFLSRLKRELRVYNPIALKDPKTIERAQDKVILDFIRESFLQKWAHENNIFITHKNLKEEIRKIKKEYNSEKSFYETLRKKNLSFGEWRRQIRVSLIEKKLFEMLHKTIPPVKDQQLIRFYKKNRKDFKLPKRIALRQILMPSLEKANIVLRQIKRSVISFEKAMEYYPHSQLLFWIYETEKGPFEKAFFMKIGQVGLAKSHKGFHVFKVIKKRAFSYQVFQKVKGKIKKTLTEKDLKHAYKKWLKKQLQSTPVFKNKAILKSLILKQVS